MRYKPAVALISVVIIFFVGWYCAFFSTNTFGSLSSCLLYPVLRVQQLVIEPVQFFLRKRAAIYDLELLYTRLQKDYEQVLAENIALQAMHFYIQETKELSDFKKRYYPKRMYVAQVLARHLSEKNQFFLVNAGTCQGIKKDMVVIYENCLIGRVAHVYPWYCKVCLITDVECKVAAVCSKTGASGILEGTNNVDSIALEYVSHLDKVEDNDMLFSSGDGLIFPNGFGLGKIMHVSKKDLFYSIEVKPLLDFRSLRYCIILSKDEIENG